MEARRRMSRSQITPVKRRSPSGTGRSPRTRRRCRRRGGPSRARATLRHFAPSAVNDDAFVEWFAEFARLSASPGAVIALDRMNLEVDVRGILSAVHVPTLVFHRVGELDADIGGGALHRGAHPRRGLGGTAWRR